MSSHASVCPSEDHCSFFLVCATSDPSSRIVFVFSLFAPRRFVFVPCPDVRHKSICCTLLLSLCFVLCSLLGGPIQHCPVSVHFQGHVPLTTRPRKWLGSVFDDPLSVCCPVHLVWAQGCIVSCISLAKTERILTALSCCLRRRGDAEKMCNSAQVLISGVSGHHFWLVAPAGCPPRSLKVVPLGSMMPRHLGISFPDCAGQSQWRTLHSTECATLISQNCFTGHFDHSFPQFSRTSRRFSPSLNKNVTDCHGLRRRVSVQASSFELCLFGYRV